MHFVFLWNYDQKHNKCEVKCFILKKKKTCKYSKCYLGTVTWAYLWHIDKPWTKLIR